MRRTQVAKTLFLNERREGFLLRNCPLILIRESVFANVRRGLPPVSSKQSQPKDHSTRGDGHEKEGRESGGLKKEKAWEAAKIPRRGQGGPEARSGANSATTYRRRAKTSKR